VSTLLSDVRKIAVLRANALGDYLFATPALLSLKAAYPGAELTLLGDAWHTRVLPGRPGPVDRAVLVPPLPGVRAPVDGEPADPAAFLEWARGERFDVAVQLHGGGRNSNPLVAALGARVTAGARAADAPALDRWIPYVYYQPEVFRLLEVVGLVGAEPVTFRPAFAVTPADRAELAAVGAATGPRVVLHPGATDRRRRWPAERFAAVGDRLAEAGAEVVVTGVAAERELVDRVCAAMRRPARALVDELSIGGLAALLADAALLVSNDTGPLHLAAAVGTPAVGLFWVGNMINGAGMYRARYRALISWTIHCPECGADCTRDLYPARTGGTACRHSPSFVADIPVEEVLQDALDLLAAGAEAAGAEAAGVEAADARPGQRWPAAHAPGGAPVTAPAPYHLRLPS
jgi:ADP-heptose:LPS heptosyltransferase